ncbi:MAG: hypothetical protein J6R52_03670 [Alphaproteobacteria bacterium]|nr:hypothetical protein [Alphaproteobacteria bacterium]
MFVSLLKYKKVKEERDELFAAVNALRIYKKEKERLIPETVRLQDEIDFLSKQVLEYKKLYADELQKRLELYEIIKKSEYEK